MNKRKMLVSQWKQEVVACVLRSLEESKRQSENSLNRSGRNRRAQRKSKGRVGRTEEQRRQPGQQLGSLNLLVGLAAQEKNDGAVE